MGPGAGKMELAECAAIFMLTLFACYSQDGIARILIRAMRVRYYYQTEHDVQSHKLYLFLIHRHRHHRSLIPPTLVKRGRSVWKLEKPLLVLPPMLPPDDNGGVVIRV